MDPLTGGILAGQVLNVGGGLFGQRRQYKYNKRLAAFQHEQNMELLKYQLDYNSPASQMGRFKEAGLNPNLVYGQGSPGNMDSPPKYPDIRPPDMQSATADLFTRYQQGRLLSEQADLTKQKVVESGEKQAVMKAQKDLIRANPYLKEGYTDLLFSNLSYAAQIKESQSILQNFQAKHYRDVDGGYSIGETKIVRELELLEQRYSLGQSDQKIKAEIINSKEFQNSLLEVQKRWMQDGEITSQHIYQFIMLLIQRLASK